MSFKINLDNVEPWAPGSAILGHGTHPIRVAEEEVDESGDHPVVKLQLVAVGGEEEGGEIRDWVHYTEKTKGRIAQIYKAFKVKFPAGEFEWIPVLGKQANVFVGRVPRRDGKTDDAGNVLFVSEVKSYSPLDSSGVVSEVKDAFAGSEVPSGDPGPEIPF